MRVIAGSARSLPLKTLSGMETRPTTDRTKETLFNMLQPLIADCRFLDLCSGSGGIGIEALSRGAAFSVFVEKNPKAVQCIKDNLEFTKLASGAKVMAQEAVSALRMLEGEEPFDCIFMDPPYGHGIEREILEYLSNSSLAGNDCCIVVESDLTTSYEYLDQLGFQIRKYKKYKTNAHIFIERKESK